MLYKKLGFGLVLAAVLDLRVFKVMGLEKTSQHITSGLSAGKFYKLKGEGVRNNGKGGKFRYRKEFIFSVTDGFFVGEILDQSLDLYIYSMVETG